MFSIRQFTLFFILSITFFIAHCGQKPLNETELYKTPPTLSDAMTIIAENDTLMPVNLQIFNDTLYISYYRRPEIDMFSPELEKIGTIALTDPEPIYPTSFAITDSFIIVSDHAKRVVAIYDRKGAFRESFGLLPDGKTQLSPFGLTYYGGVLYVSDIGLGKILAISLTDAKDITEVGELILKIPSDTAQTIGFPSSLEVTFDGRLFVGDAQNAIVKVFTCDGRHIYNFNAVPTQKPFSPMGFSFDSMMDPAIQDLPSFDPSGVRKMGRIHVVDSNNRTVHIFNPLGKYISSYKLNEKMVKPSDIAIDRKRGRIFVADPQARQIFIYTYESN